MESAQIDTYRTQSLADLNKLLPGQDITEENIKAVDYRVVKLLDSIKVNQKNTNIKQINDILIYLLQLNFTKKSRDNFRKCRSTWWKKKEICINKKTQTYLGKILDSIHAKKTLKATECEWGKLNTLSKAAKDHSILYSKLGNDIQQLNQSEKKFLRSHLDYHKAAQDLWMLHDLERDADTLNTHRCEALEIDKRRIESKRAWVTKNAKAKTTYSRMKKAKVFLEALATELHSDKGAPNLAIVIPAKGPAGQQGY